MGSLRSRQFESVEPSLQSSAAAVEEVTKAAVLSPFEDARTC